MRRGHTVHVHARVHAYRPRSMFRHELLLANTRNDKLARGRLTMSTGENLLHILNTLESRAAVLEAELREIDEDIALNANMARKYGDEFFTEGSARLMQTRVDKQQRLAEISTQLQQTGQSVQQGKQLLGSLMDNYGHPVPACPPCPPGKTYSLASSREVCAQVAPSPSVMMDEQPSPSLAMQMHENHPFREGLSPTKILTTSPILAERRGESR